MPGPPPSTHSSHPFLRDSMEAVLQEFDGEPIAVLAGAGISRAMPSSLPTVDDLFEGLAALRL